MDIALRGNPGDTIQRWFGYLHFGNFGGVPVKILWFILGLAPAALAVTGTLMWWNRVWPASVTGDGDPAGYAGKRDSGLSGPCLSSEHDG